MITLDLFHTDGRPITDDNELGVEASSKDHIRIPNAPYSCRWCGRDLLEPSCPHGCGHTWIVDNEEMRTQIRTAQLRTKSLEL